MGRPTIYTGAVLWRDVPAACGVYALFQGELCAYVGASLNMRKRVAHHDRHGHYSQVVTWPTERHNLAQAETDAIARLQPALNRKAKSNHRRSFRQVSA